jgi:hypothetical protein
MTPEWTAATDAGAEPAASRERRDAAFRAAELATRDALLALTPVERLEWLAEALDFAWAAGALPAAGRDR